MYASTSSTGSGFCFAAQVRMIPNEGTYFAVQFFCKLDILFAVFLHALLSFRVAIHDFLPKRKAFVLYFTTNLE
jgi:hypothetical protein